MKKFLSSILLFSLFLKPCFADGIDPNALLVCNLNGTDASTPSNADESQYARTATWVGNAQLDTAQFKYATASALYDGSGDSVTFPDSADWDLGTGDFTLECFVRFALIGSAAQLITVGDGGSGPGVRMMPLATAIRVNINGGADLDFAWIPLIDTWYHVAICRASGTLRAFVDGSQVGADTSAGTDFGTVADTVKINRADANTLNGWIDGVRISNIARYTGTFTPPTGNFTAPDTSKFLQVFD